MSNWDILATPSSQLTPGESDNKQQQLQSIGFICPVVREKLKGMEKPQKG